MWFTVCVVAQYSTYMYVFPSNHLLGNVFTSVNTTIVSYIMCSSCNSLELCHIRVQPSLSCVWLLYGLDVCGVDLVSVDHHSHSYGTHTIFISSLSVCGRFRRSS